MTNENEKQIIKEQRDPLNSLEVTKNTKGYNWSLKCRGDDVEEVFNRLVSLEKKVKEAFAN